MEVLAFHDFEYFFPAPSCLQCFRMKKQEFRKYEERLRYLWDNFKHPNVRIIGVPEGEEQEHKIEDLCEQIMKENFPNLMKEIDFQEV